MNEYVGACVCQGIRTQKNTDRKRRQEQKPRMVVSRGKSSFHPHLYSLFLSLSSKTNSPLSGFDRISFNRKDDDKRADDSTSLEDYFKLIRRLDLSPQQLNIWMFGEDEKDQWISTFGQLKELIKRKARDDWKILDQALVTELDVVLQELNISYSPSDAIIEEASYGIEDGREGDCELQQEELKPEDVVEIKRDHVTSIAMVRHDQLVSFDFHSGAIIPLSERVELVEQIRLRHKEDKEMVAWENEAKEFLTQAHRKLKYFFWISWINFILLSRNQSSILALIGDFLTSQSHERFQERSSFLTDLLNFPKMVLMLVLFILIFFIIIKTVPSIAKLFALALFYFFFPSYFVVAVYHILRTLLLFSSYSLLVDWTLKWILRLDHFADLPTEHISNSYSFVFDPKRRLFAEFLANLFLVIALVLSITNGTYPLPYFSVEIFLFHNIHFFFELVVQAPSLADL